MATRWFSLQWLSHPQRLEHIKKIYKSVGAIMIHFFSFFTYTFVSLKTERTSSGWKKKSFSSYHLQWSTYLQAIYMIYLQTTIGNALRCKSMGYQLETKTLTRSLNISIHLIKYIFYIIFNFKASCIIKSKLWLVWSL